MKLDDIDTRRVLQDAHDMLRAAAGIVVLLLIGHALGERRERLRRAMAVEGYQEGCRQAITIAAAAKRAVARVHDVDDDTDPED